MVYYIPNTDTIISDEEVYQDTEAYKAHSKYVRTLEKLGTIDSKEEEMLGIYLLVKELYIYYSINDLFTDDIKNTLLTIEYCIMNNSCLFN